MKRFQFNLEALQKVYHLYERNKKIALARVRQALFQAIEQHEELWREFAELQKNETARREKGQTVQQMKFFVQYSFELKLKIEHTEKEIQELRRREEIARRELVEAQRRVKTLDLLREKRFAAWKKDRKKWEQNQTDEVAQNRKLHYTST